MSWFTVRIIFTILTLFSHCNRSSSFRYSVYKDFSRFDNHHLLYHENKGISITEEKLTELKGKISVILDETLRHLQENQTLLTPKLPAPFSHSAEIEINKQSSSVTPPAALIKDVMEVDVELKKLGYSDLEIYMLKDNVKLRIIDLQLQRPSQIPKIWMQSDIPSETTQSSRVTSRLGKSRKYFGSTSWVNPSFLPEQEDRSSKYSYSYLERSTTGDDLKVWPSREEFKDLLLEESRLRVNTVGKWIALLVRSENKWRFKLYDQWLRFLNEGFGDQMDVMEQEEEEAEDPITSSSKSRSLPKIEEHHKNQNQKKQRTNKRIFTRREDYEDFIHQQQKKIRAFLAEQEEEESQRTFMSRFDQRGRGGGGERPSTNEEEYEEEDEEDTFTRDNLFNNRKTLQRSRRTPIPRRKSSSGPPYPPDDDNNNDNDEV